MTKPILYSTGCPACKIIESKLDAKNIQYDKINDIEEMEKLGITRVPVLSIDGKLMELGEANKWINAQ